MCIHLATLQMFRQDLWPAQHTHTLPHIFSSENRTWEAILAFLASCNVLRALLSLYSGSHFRLFFLSPLHFLLSLHHLSPAAILSLLSPAICIFATAVTWPRWLVPGLGGGKPRMRIHWPGPWQAVNLPYATLHTRGKHTLHAEQQESTLTQTHQSSAVENFAHYRI